MALFFTAKVTHLVSFSCAILFSGETYTPTTKLSLERKAVLHEAGCIINDMVHEEIEKQPLERKTSCYHHLAYTIKLYEFHHSNRS